MAESRSNGIGFSGVLAIAFIVLKLTGTIHWSWLWVLAPIWLPFAFAIGLIVAVIVGRAIMQLLRSTN